MKTTDNQEANEYLIKKISRESGCDADLAKMLLDFTHGDENGVFRILSAVPKNILVIKGKFIAQRRKLYGLFLIFYDKMRSDVAKLEGVVSVDREASRMDIHASFGSIVEFLKRYRSESEADLWDKMEAEGLLARLNQVMTAEYWPKMIQEDKQDILERELIKAYDRTLAKFLNDNQMTFKLDLENINEFQFAQSYVIEQSEPEPVQDEPNNAEDVLEQSVPDDAAANKNFIMLQCEPEVSPVTGKEAGSLVTGDEVFVRVNDQRDIARYIKSLLLQQHEEMDLNQPIPCAVKNIKELDTGNIRIFVEFGPGIHGQMVVQREIKIKSKENSSKVKVVDAADTKMNFYFWGIILSALALGAILVALLFFQD